MIQYRPSYLLITDQLTVAIAEKFDDRNYDEFDKWQVIL